MAHIANKIDAKDKKLSEILSGQRYRVDSFQREYRWQRKHIESLINDLYLSFHSSYEDNHKIDDVEKYDCYYMGPVVLCEDRNELSIVDGQQRLTSFTLLLIYLHHLQKNIKSEYDLRELNTHFFVRKSGKNTLILNVDTRESIIRDLIEKGSATFEEYSDLEGTDESVINIINRYQDIESLFPEELKKDEILPLFIEWLLEKIVLVEVKAYSMENAYTIFETMNDRGMTLSPTEILKGYLLSKITDEKKSEEANDFWKHRISKLNRETKTDADLEFFRAWLRAKYAETTRATKAGAENEDFELIATQFNTWVKNNTKKVYLKNTDDYYYFIVSDFNFFSEQFINLYNYKNYLTDDFEDLYINNFYPIADSLYYPLLLSSISKMDNIETIKEKLNIVNHFIDVYTNIRVLSNKSITQSTIRYTIYDLIREIRNKSIEELKEILSNRYNELKEKGDNFSYLKTMNNWGYGHYLFARINYYLMEQKVDFQELMRSRKQNSYVLQRIFSYDDFEESNIYLFDSISNYCLIRRPDMDKFSSIKKIEKKIEFLLKKSYLPDMENSNNISTNITEFIEVRERILQNLVEKIWEFQN